VFADTAAWIALINTGDSLNAQAEGVYKTLRQRRALLVTSEFVLLEVADALCAPAFRQRTSAYIESLRQPGVLNIVPVSDTLLAKGWELYRQRPDKGWGLTDCTSFVVMQEEQITEAFTSDHHFEQAGFVKLL
jgi:predicted nucleic acid-binding protein